MPLIHAWNDRRARPELFTPPRAGEMLAGGAGASVYNIDARGADAGVELRIHRAIAESQNRAVARSTNAVLEARLHGGRFARAFD